MSSKLVVNQQKDQGGSEIFHETRRHGDADAGPNCNIVTFATDATGPSEGGNRGATGNIERGAQV